MPQPAAYTPTEDFSQDEVNGVGGRSTIRTAALDGEFDGIALSIGGIRTNLALNQRDDGEIRDERVKLPSLGQDVRALLAIGGGTLARTFGEWATSTHYDAGLSIVVHAGDTYICAVSHTSGVFATDFAGVKWLLLALGAGVSASGVPFTPTTLLSSTNVQAAVEEVAAIASTSALSVVAQFATSLGSSLIGHIHDAIGAVVTTVRAKLRTFVDPVLDFGVPTDGVSDCQPALQRMLDALALKPVSEARLPPGTYVVKNPNNEAGWTCALVARGLKDFRFKLSGGAKIVFGSGGAGAAEFGLIRGEQCEGFEWTGGEIDGSGITLTGTGGNRARCFIFTNFDVNTQADLAVTNKRVHIHHTTIRNVGGTVLVARRASTAAATPVTEQFTFEHNNVYSAIGQDGGVGLNFVRTGSVQHNRFINPIQASPFDSMTVDASQGCEHVVIKNNYGYGFMFGMKCETASLQGPAANETRPSKNITIEDNTLEEIGHPTLLEVAGPSGGATFGIKVNGIDCKARGNVVKARTIDVTTGGLTSGLAGFNTHLTESMCLIEGNHTTGGQYGFTQSGVTDPTGRKEITKVVRNHFDDAALFGIVAVSNITVEDNDIHRAGKSAVIVQTPFDTYVRRNNSYNSGSVNSDYIASKVVFLQEHAMSVGFFEIAENNIFDDRGGSAANYGYFLRGGQVAGNNYIFRPGYTQGLATAIAVDDYFSCVGQSLQAPNTLAPAPRTFLSTNIPSATAPASTRPWNVGDRALRTVQAVGSPKAWTCTTAGTPGTWTSEGNL